MSKITIMPAIPSISAALKWGYLDPLISHGQFHAILKPDFFRTLTSLCQSLQAVLQFFSINFLIFHYFACFFSIFLYFTKRSINYNICTKFLIFLQYFQYYFYQYLCSKLSIKYWQIRILGGYALYSTWSSSVF